MTGLKRAGAAIGLVLAVAGAWAYRAQLAQLVSVPRAEEGKPIVFDNGSVRAERVQDPLASPVARHGEMRKCVGKRDTLYSDRECPAGYKEAAVRAAERVTVVRNDASARPAPAQGTPGDAPRRTLHDVLDMKPDPALRERMMERAAGGSH